MAQIFMRVVLLIVFAGLGIAVASCREGPAPQPLTDDERATIGDTVRRLYREASQTFDSDLDCEEIVTRLAPAGQMGTFVAQGRLVEPASSEEMVKLCRAIKQNRTSAHEEIVDDRVEVLARDAAVLVTRSVYTVQLRDGRTIVQPQVVTTVWARSSGEWRRVHLHESWQLQEQPPEAPSGTSSR